MNEPFAVLTLTQSPRNPVLPTPEQLPHPDLSLESSAFLLFTDLRHGPVISVLDTTRIDIALDRMVYSGVRLLFAVNGDFELSGLVTAYDIAGEKPMLALQSRDRHFGSGSRGELEVRDVMQPVAQWKTLDFMELRHARIGHLVATFRQAQHRHLIVLERLAGQTHPIVRGLFSATRVERALGIPLDPFPTLETFADVERALVH